jgi:hypothetical protein
MNTRKKWRAIACSALLIQPLRRHLFRKRELNPLYKNYPSIILELSITFWNVTPCNQVEFHATTTLYGVTSQKNCRRENRRAHNFYFINRGGGGSTPQESLSSECCFPSTCSSVWVKPTSVFNKESEHDAIITCVDLCMFTSSCLS